MRAKKYIAYITILTVIITAVCGCRSDGKDLSSGDAGSSASGIFSTDDVVYADSDGDSRYAIVRPDNASADVTGAATAVFSAMKNSLGLRSKNILDSVSDGSDAYEILIGETNRTESTAARDYFEQNFAARTGEFFICTVGKKICIIAVGDEAYKNAAGYFCENYLKSGTVTGGIFYNHNVEGDFADITVNGTNIKYYRIVRQHFNGSYLTQMEIEKLVSAINEMTGYEIPVVDDEYSDESDFEILIGNTNRGSRKYDSRDQYEIAVDGTKVTINGGSYYATALGVSEFTRLIEKSAITSGDSYLGSYAETVSGYDRSKYYTPTWYDDFDGDTVDTSKWRVVGSGESVYSGQHGKICDRSDEPDVIYVRDGCFNIAAKLDEQFYYGGMLRTDTTMDYRYGFIEYSAKLPEGEGYWITLWMCGNEEGSILSPEIDVNESFGDSRVIAANCHSWPTSIGTKMGYEHTSLDNEYGNRKRYYCPDGKKFSDGFHTFGFLWTKSEMTFTCDGKAYFSYDITTTPEDIECFNHKMFLILSMIVGAGDSPYDIEKMTPEQWQNTNKFITDNIYLYQLSDGVSELNVH